MDSTAIESPAGDNIKKRGKWRNKNERKKRAKKKARIVLEMHDNSEKASDCKVAIDNLEKTDLTAQPPGENLKIDVASTEILSEGKLKSRKKNERKKQAKIKARIGLEMHDNSEKTSNCKVAIDNSEKSDKTAQPPGENSDKTAQPPGENLKIDVGSTEILSEGKKKGKNRKKKDKRARDKEGAQSKGQTNTDAKVGSKESPVEDEAQSTGQTKKKRKKRKKKMATIEDGAQSEGQANCDAEVGSKESPVEDEAQSTGQTKKKRKKRKKKMATIEDRAQSEGQANCDAKVGSTESPVEDEAQSTGQTKKKRKKKRNKKKATVEDGAQSEGQTNSDTKVGSIEIPVEGEAQSMVQKNVDVGSTENPTEGNVTKKRKRKPKKATVGDETQSMGQTNVDVGSTENPTEGNVTNTRKRKPKKAAVEDETQSVGKMNADVGSTENLTEGNVTDERKKKRKSPKKAPVDVGSTGNPVEGNVTRQRKMKRIKIENGPIVSTRRKLLVLDLNGLLADIVTPPPKHHKGDTRISGREIFKRPFCDDFLKFCFDNFDVGIWSSRSKLIIHRVVDYLLGDLQSKLLFCWDMSHSTQTGVKTLENYHKPLVCKELRKIWENENPTLGWKKGDYDESNTLLLDDSPYKALLNPLHTAIFPDSYSFMNKKDDNSLGPGGDLRVYLEGLLASENVQKYVEQHPFGQRAISEKNVSWGFYSEVLNRVSNRLGKKTPVKPC